MGPSKGCGISVSSSVYHVRQEGSLAASVSIALLDFPPFLEEFWRPESSGPDLGSPTQGRGVP